MPEQETVEVVAAGQLALSGGEAIVFPDDMVRGKVAAVDSEVETGVTRGPGGNCVS